MRDGKATQRRVLIIGADGLRPDLLDPETMPTVSRLAAGGARGTDHHAVFPTHTRVNVSTLTTGTTPGNHGIVANTMLVPFATDDHVIDTSRYQQLAALAEHSGGRTLFTSTLGDLLATRGERLAVVATGSAGSTLLWTPDHPGRLVNPGTAFGLADLHDLREKLGELPPPERPPHVERLRYATRAVTDLFLDNPDNRVIVLWMAEPDSSLHAFGLGSPESIAAMRAVDHRVAEVLAALDARGLRDQFDLFFISDHGHSTVESHTTLREHLVRAEEELGRSLPPLATASDFIYARPGFDEPTADGVRPLVEWLQAQPWADLVLGGRDDIAALPGVIPLERVWNGRMNPRRPLLAISPRWHDDVNAFGVPGSVMSLTTQSALKSSHGSASPYDLHAVLVVNGPSMGEGVVSTLPSGGVDLLPTVLTLLDMPVPDHLDGRVLQELLRHPRGDQVEAVNETVGPERPGPARHGPKLRLHRVGATTYLHGSLCGRGPNP